MICCKICNGSGTFRPESATCYCTPTDNGKRYVKGLYSEHQLSIAHNYVLLMQDLTKYWGGKNLEKLRKSANLKRKLKLKVTNDGFYSFFIYLHFVLELFRFV